MRRIAAAVIAALALAAAFVVAGRIHAASAQSVRTEAHRRAEAARVAAKEAVAAQLGQVEARAVAAASLQAVQALANNGADGPTILDGLNTEAWWTPTRTEFLVSGLVVDDENAGVIGLEKDQALPAALLQKARAEHRASDVFDLNGEPFYAAAAAVPVPTRSGQVAVVVLAKPLAPSLPALAERVRGAVLLSNGKIPLASAGPDAEKARLAALVGREPEGVVEGSEDASAALPLAGSDELWCFASAHDVAVAAESAAGTSTAAVWGGGALLALLALAFGFRPARSHEETQLLRETAQQLANAQAQLARLTSTQEALHDTAPSLATSAQRVRTGSGAAVDANPVTLAPGVSPGSSNPNVFGRYYLLNRLASGGMGDVYTAVTFGAEGFKRTYVVKRLRAELAREPEVVSQFVDEARLGSLLVHSNVVPVFDFGKVGDEYFLAQEYILGRDLDRMTTRSVETTGAALPVDLVFYVAHEVLKALSYAHTLHDETGKPLHLVHRDVSPNNVLVSARGEVKLFDFGIVKALGRSTRTEAGVVKGNVSFMSPEQARALEVDPRADLFSLGMVMYRLLTGRYLYNGNTSYELLMKAGAGPNEADLAELSKLPEPAASIIGKAIATDPAQRYASAADFAAALPPARASAAAELGALVQRLFGEDLAREQANLNAAIPSVPVAASGA